MQNNRMKKFEVHLQSDVYDSFRCRKAANSLDIDISKKSKHDLTIEADIESDFSIGLILGASGSGKTTLAKSIYGNDCFKTILDENKPIIDQLNDSFEYEQCADLLTGIGLNSVPCWIRPVKTLSNGQRARAEATLLMANSNELSVIDEWTSVVDRTVAKAMSHCIQKFARKNKKKIVLLSCHYDVVEWLNPDWIIDCNKQSFENRRLLSCNERKRTEKLKFEIEESDKHSWKYFSKYHYLSEKLPVYNPFIFGLFHNENQIGFVCFSNYVPHVNKKEKMILHFNRLVIHPDYAGLGLGIKFVNETANIVSNRNYKVMGTFSSIPVFKAMSKDPLWKYKGSRNMFKKGGGSSNNKNYMRMYVKMHSFEYINSTN